MGQSGHFASGVGPTYQNLELVTDISDPADIERVRITYNGKEIISLSGQDMVDLQEHRSNYVSAGRYVIPFSDMTMRTKLGVRQGELVTLPGEIWFVYIQLVSKSAAAPSIRARAHITEAQTQRVFMPRLYSLTWFASAAGRTPFDWSERSPYLSIKRIHFKDSSIIRARVLRDDREEMNVSKEDNAFDLSYAGLEQNDGWFSLDFVRTGFGSESKLKTQAVRALQFELEKSASGSVPLIIEPLSKSLCLSPLRKGAR